MIQLTNHMKHKKKEDQSVDASVPLRRGGQNNTGSRGREGYGRVRRGGKKGGRIRHVRILRRGSGN